MYGKGIVDFIPSPDDNGGMYRCFRALCGPGSRPPHAKEVVQLKAGKKMNGKEKMQPLLNNS